MAILTANHCKKNVRLLFHFTTAKVYVGIIENMHNWFRLFVKALLAVVCFVCVLASYRQLAEILFPPLFFPFACLIFEWIVCSFLGAHDFS